MSAQTDKVRLSTGQLYRPGGGQGIGGHWDEIGLLQFDFMASRGLMPHDRLLDIGCGSLRGGVHFVRYLDNGNYYGLDKEDWLLVAAREVELPRHGLASRQVHLLQDSEFSFSRFGATFSFALAQSVFTHISWNQILRCLSEMARVLEPEGQFFATYLEDEGGRHRTRTMSHASTSHARPIVSYPDRDPFHYEFDVFEELAARTGLEVERLGDWGHPRENHYMMRFTRAP